MASKTKVKGVVLDIDRQIGGFVKVRPRIAKVGIELEGGWKKLPEGCNEVERDGSVANLVDDSVGPAPKIRSVPDFGTGPDQVTEIKWDDMAYSDKIVLVTKQQQLQNQDRLAYQAWHAKATQLHIGELASDPIPYGDKISKWIKQSYPSHVNNTCGLHVHMSFLDSRHYDLLMTPDYQETIIEYLSRWGRKQGFAADHLLFHRLAGKNDTCQREFWPDLQVQKTHKQYHKDRPGHRYTIINYCHNTDGRQTVECRVLPMFPTSEVAIDAVWQVLHITNACLVKLNYKEPKFKIEAEFTPGKTEEYLELDTTIPTENRVWS